MSDFNIRISVDPATGDVGVTSDAGGGPAPMDLGESASAAVATGAAPGPATDIVAGGQEAEAAGGFEGPPPQDPSALGIGEAAEAAVVGGEAAPPPEDLEVFVAEAVAAAEEASPKPMSIADLDKGTKAKATTRAKPKPKPRTPKKKS